VGAALLEAVEAQAGGGDEDGEDEDRVAARPVRQGRRPRLEEALPHLAVGDRSKDQLVHGEGEDDAGQDHLHLGHVAVGQVLGQALHAQRLYPDLRGAAKRQPADTLAQLGRRPGELGLNLLAALAEVAPTLVVDRDRGLRAQQPAELDRLPSLRAPASVVITVPARGSSARPAASRLSS
jgi:hypothetical protein